MTHVRVKPTREGESLVHPLDGPLPAEGGLWRRDQFTFKRMRDGDIVETEDPPEGDALAEEPAPAASTEPAAAAAPAPAPGTVASVPFMITGAMRKRLRALGKTDDEIGLMKPEDAQALLAAADTPTTDGPTAADTPKE